MKKIVCIFFVFVTCRLVAQPNFSMGWLPKINVSAKINKNTKWVNSIELRENLFYNDKLEFKHKLIDIGSILSLKTDFNQSFNFGYTARFSGKKIIHRLSKHYYFITNFSELKFANRLGFEQFFTKRSKPQYRIRYRVTLKKALEGKRIDVKEFYLKVANEYLYHFNKEDMEIRLAPYLGYKLSKTEKLEFGFEYRLSKFLNNTTKNNLRVRTSCYISF